MSEKFTTFSMFWIQEHHTYAEKGMPISRSFHEPLLNAETSSEHVKSWSLFFIQKSQYSNRLQASQNLFMDITAWLRVADV